MKNKETKIEIKERDLEKPGVGKLLYMENKDFKDELTTVKKSLKKLQNEHEKLRMKNFETDKENTLLSYRLHINFIPEALKFLSSAGGLGFAVGLYFQGHMKYAYIVGGVSIFIYIIILFCYRSPKKDNR